MASNFGNRIEIDNIIRISNQKEIVAYIQSVFMRGQPRVYERYACIKIRFAANLARDVDWLCRNFWHWGLVPDPKSLKKIRLKLDKGVMLGNAYELTLKKVPAICFTNDQEYNEWLPELNKIANEQLPEGLEEED